MVRRAWRVLAISIASAVLFGAIVLATVIGPVYIPPATVAAIILNKTPLVDSLFKPNWPSAYESIVILVRLPRAILGALVGAALALSGAVMQGMFRNPLADPYVLGLAAGGTFGASVSIVLGVSLGLGLAKYSILFFAFVFTLLTALLVYGISRVGSKVPVETLLLAGVAVSTFFWSINSFMKYLAGEKLEAIVFWIMGGLWLAGWGDVALVVLPITLGSIAILLFSRDLNAMLTGEEVASSLGVNVETAKKALLALSSLLVASAVAVSGPIGFIGLVVPHMVRLITGPDHKILLPLSSLTGATFLTLSDLAAKLIIRPAELPVGIITASTGAPFFIYLLRRRKRAMGWVS
ncbi:MAG: Cobalamin import system permease protein BtuC [Candidatus Bathyarchaeota archaeon BA2]|nr:MAG: Cobalamin import system permease protein BtuC [Candidatus Bathyarchaeota archaeon BA2]